MNNVRKDEFEKMSAQLVPVIGSFPTFWYKQIEENVQRECFMKIEGLIGNWFWFRFWREHVFIPQKRPWLFDRMLRGIICGLLFLRFIL